jgi:hypothetical protein
MPTAIKQVATSPRLIVFPGCMAAQNPIPLEGQQGQERSGHDPAVHGSKAAIAAAIFAGLAMIGTFATAYVNWSNRSDQKTHQANADADAHSNSLIDAKVSLAAKAVNDHTDQKIGDLSNQIHALDVRIARLEGPLASRVSTLEQRAEQQASLAKLVLGDLQRSLNTTDRSAPTYWPVVSEFISYRSQISVEDYQQLLRHDLPNCVDKPPVPMKVTMDAAAEMARKLDVEANKGTRFAPALYEDCRFTLDSPEEVASIPELGQGNSYDLTFRRCQIVYHGGPIRIFVTNPRPTPITGYGPTRSDVFVVMGQTIRFEKCLFVFDIKSQPSTEGQSLTQQLLTQSGPTLTVKFPS